MATVTRYVNTASSGGDGTTNATSGATAAYASLAAWNTAQATDLVAAGDSHVVICTGGADALAADVSLAGWTTGASNTLTIRSDDVRTPANGFADGYRLTRSASSGLLACITGIRDYTTISNIRAISTATGTGTPYVFALSGLVYAALVIDKCWLRLSGSSSNTKDGLRSSSTADNSTSIVVSNSVLDAVSVTSGASYGFRGSSASAAQVKFRNCTITGHTGAGILANQETITATNCAVFNNADDFLVSAGSITASYCASDDGDGTNAVNISPGATEADDWAAAFTDYVNGDYTVKDASSVLYNAGTDLSGSGITDDHIGTARPQSTAYDIGAFELEVATGPATAEIAVTFVPATGYSYVTLSGYPGTGYVVGEDASPAVVDGDQVEYESTASSGAGVTVNADGTFVLDTVDPGHFQYRVRDDTDNTWSDWETIYVNEAAPSDLVGAAPSRWWLQTPKRKRKYAGRLF